MKEGDVVIRRGGGCDPVKIISAKDGIATVVPMKPCKKSSWNEPLYRLMPYSPTDEQRIAIGDFERAIAMDKRALRENRAASLIPLSKKEVKELLEISIKPHRAGDGEPYFNRAKIARLCQMALLAIALMSFAGCVHKPPTWIDVGDQVKRSATFVRVGLQSLVQNVDLVTITATPPSIVIFRITNRSPLLSSTSAATIEIK